MHRRGFLSSIGAIATVPAVDPAPAKTKNWHCLIGAMRRGKATRAAKMLVDAKVDMIFCLSNTLQQIYLRQYSKLLDMDLKNCKLYPLFVNEHGMEYWGKETIQEVIQEHKPLSIGAWCCDCDPSEFHIVAELADIAIFSSWPKYTEWRDTVFYSECTKMGTVDHKVMGENFR